MSFESELVMLVKEHFDIGKIYSDERVLQFARDTYEPWDIFDENEYTPENLFSNDDLCAWAGANGFVIPEDTEDE